MGDISNDYVEKIVGVFSPWKATEWAIRRYNSGACHSSVVLLYKLLQVITTAQPEMEAQLLICCTDHDPTTLTPIERNKMTEVLLRCGGDEVGSYCLSCQLSVNQIEQ
jgi:hypothetical protein